VYDSRRANAWSIPNSPAKLHEEKNEDLIPGGFAKNGRMEKTVNTEKAQEVQTDE